MMAKKHNILARRYAQAMLQSFDVTYADVSTLYAVGSYFDAHPTCGFFLRLSSISPAEKISIIMSAINDIFSVQKRHIEMMRRLLVLLSKHNRMTLFMRVCMMLRDVYYTVHAIEACSVFTSHDIDTQDVQPVVAWLETQLGKTLEPTYYVDQSLIAGVRVCGQTFIWEDSIARNIRQMKHDAYAQWGIA